MLVRRVRVYSAILIQLLFATASSALTIAIGASDSGFHSAAGNHSASNEDYVAGWSNLEFRDFFVFDLSSLPLGETVLSATLRAYNPDVCEPECSYTGGYQSPEATEAYQLREVLLPAAVVTAPSVGNPTVFNDLGDGSIFGTYLASSADNGQFIEIALNGAGIATVQTFAGVGEFVLGGQISPLTASLGVNEFVFGYSDPPGFGPYTRELVITMTPEPGTGALLALGLVAVASARRRRLRTGFGAVLALGVLGWLAPNAANAATEIKVLSNRADLISDGDALVEVVPAPPPGTIVRRNGVDVTGQFALRANGRYMGVVNGLAVGPNTLRVTRPDATGASIRIDNHPPEGPVFGGPHLRFWDCTTEANGLGPPQDVHCNVDPVVEYFYISTAGGGYQAYDLDNPPADVATTTTDQGHTVRHVVRQETGVLDRGIYAFAVLHDPDLPLAPWEPQDGWNGKIYYPFGASCNTNYTQGSAPGVLDQTRLSEGFAVATNSLNVLGHHCSTIISAEAAMMTKERFIEQYGVPRFTVSTGGSGGSIGQLQVSNMYPGITNGLIPSQLFPDNWSTGMEVLDCVLTEGYWPKAAIPFTPLQKSAVDGHGPTQTSCTVWIGTYAPAGIPSTGCFGGTSLPATNIPSVEARDYNPVTNPDGCRATAQDIQVNIFGRRPQDGFANLILENIGVQYGLDALNLPVGSPGKITFAQFLDLNAKIGGSDVDGVPTTDRSRAAPGVTEIAYRSSAFNDGRGLASAAIIALPATGNLEVHTPHHTYALEDRLVKANGHGDNFAIWHGGPSATAWSTMNSWLTAIEAAGGIDPLTGMNAAKVVGNKPATAYDSCWSGGVQGPLSNCAADVYGAARTEAGMPRSHDILECTLKPVTASDYAGAVPPLTAVDLAAIRAIFPQGVCDYTVESPHKVPSVPWLTYENGPGGQPLGAPPASTPF